MSTFKVELHCDSCNTSAIIIIHDEHNPPQYCPFCGSDQESENEGEADLDTDLDVPEWTGDENDD